MISRKAVEKLIKYRENEEVSEIFKERYAAGIESLICAREQTLSSVRREYCKDIFSDGERYRDDFKKMLGWPLIGQKDATVPQVQKEMPAKEQGYIIYRMTFTVLEDLLLSGLCFEMDGDEAKPLVLVQHGGSGTPELISGVYGDTANYNRILERVIKRRTHAFAAQLLLWDEKQHGIAYNRRDIDARLKRVGSSITAVELYGLKRILDYFEAQSNISAFGMVGLSYGGFYSLFLAAVDTRIRSAISCSFFNMRDKVGWSDWTWFGSAGKFDDAEVAALVYPRKLCIEIGTKDDLFDVTYGIKSYERLQKMCEDVGTNWFSFITFEGGHEFCRDDAPIEALVRELNRQ